MKKDQSITVFIATDQDVAKEIIQKYLDKETLPYVNMMDDVTYEEVTTKLEELEGGEVDTVKVSKELWHDLTNRHDRAVEQAKEYASKYNTAWSIAFVFAVLFIGSFIW